MWKSGVINTTFFIDCVLLWGGAGSTLSGVDNKEAKAASTAKQKPLVFTKTTYK